MQILQYIFSSFWIWLGCVILIYILGMVATTFVGTIISTIRGDNVKIKAGLLFGEHIYSSVRHEEEAEEARKLKAIKDIVEYSLKQAGYQLMLQETK